MLHSTTRMFLLVTRYFFFFYISSLACVHVLFRFLFWQKKTRGLGVWWWKYKNDWSELFIVVVPFLMFLIFCLIPLVCQLHCLFSFSPTPHGFPCSRAFSPPLPLSCLCMYILLDVDIYASFCLLPCSCCLIHACV